MTVSVFDDHQCSLGEGPLWHGDINTLFWFDINNNTLFHKQPGAATSDCLRFDESVSAAGIIDNDHLLLASASGLWHLNLATGNRDLVVKMEADNPRTRSNDGRADAFGGFWIGTMGRRAERGFGAIYRYYRGELRQLFANITITNSICFSPDGLTAYFTDTRDGRIWQQCLSDKDGWPVDEPTLFVNLRHEGFGADGSVVDADGNLWNAQWGASRIACYNPAGALIDSISFPSSQMSCPAFGGKDLNILFATSASENMSAAALAIEPAAGQVFAATTRVKGQAEHKVIL